MSVTIQETREGVVFRVRCRPSAPKTRLAGEHAGSLKVDLAAPPERGKANAELVRFLAKTLGVDAAAIRISAGESGREKSIRLSGITLASLAAKLAAIDGGTSHS